MTASTRLGAGLACRDVSVTLDGVPILREVDLAVEPGEWVALVGPNGAGKTTLIRTLAGTARFTGRVLLAGRPLGEMNRRELARLAAVVPQHPFVPDGMTVADYVLLGRTPHVPYWGSEGPGDLRAAAGALARLESEEFASRRLATLSGGERQRVVLARALAQEAPLLLLDEPTTGLDLGHQQQVLELVDTLRRERGLVVLSAMHDLTLAAQYAERLVFLDGGRVVAEGGPEAVLREELLAARYRARLAVLRHEGRPVVVPVRRPGGG